MTIGEGEDITCTFTNDDVPTPGTLTLEKVVINDNLGTSVDGDFTLSASGSVLIS